MPALIFFVIAVGRGIAIGNALLDRFSYSASDGSAVRLRRTLPSGVTTNAP
jgi:hypothetical protein